jgi:PAS domain S-box-containing protein
VSDPLSVKPVPPGSALDPALAEQLESICEGLARALFGDYTPVQTSTPEPALGQLAMLTNALLRSTHTALEQRDLLLESLRKKQKEIESSAAHQRAVVGAVSDALITHNESGEIVSWNPAATKLFGYSAAEAREFKLQSLFPTTRVHNLKPGKRTVVALSKQGAKIPVEIRLTDMLGSDEPLRLLTARDVSARLRFERDQNEIMASLASEQAKLRAILEGTGDGVLFFDEQDEVAWVNAHFQKLLGLLEPPGLTCSNAELAALLRARHGFDLFDRVLVLPELRSSDSIYVRVHSPTPRTLHLSTRPLLTSTGSLLGRLLVVREASREEEAEKAKDELIASVSHELRTPLTSIRGAVDLVRRGLVGKVSPSATELLDLASQSIAQLSRLVDDLVDVDRIEKVDFEMQQINLRDVMSQTIREAGPQIEAKGLELSISLPPGEIPLIADHNRLLQVFTNLLSNAVKYTSAGRVSIEAETLDGSIAVSVRDTGLGIPAAEIPLLWSRFYRSSRESVLSQSGTGLGLFITYSIVTRHGGTISVESKLGTGSCFTVTLPTSAPQGLAYARTQQIRRQDIPPVTEPPPEWRSFP